MSSVHSFQDAQENKTILGNKGANLVIMTKSGLSVPPGFILTVEAYNEYKRTNSLPMGEIKQAIAALEKQAGKSLGKDLQLSVRSSASVSMPGMMDTVLNI